jgi:alanine racemase
VADEDSVEAIAALLPGCGGMGTRYGSLAPRVHLGIDSGMGRGGLAPGRAAAAARRLLDAGLGALAGTWSHLATPEDPVSVASQVARFEGALAALHEAGIDPGVRHLDATVGLLGGACPVYDMVRVGLACYGVQPPELAAPPAVETVASSLRPVVGLRARAAAVTSLPAGASVGYGGAWVADRPSVIATIPLGYADGWARAYASDSWGVVRGRRVPVVGRISSDALALDVTDVPEFTADDQVALLDPGDATAMTVHELAMLRGTIVWEVLDALTPRLARVYTDDGRPVGVRYLDGETRFAAGW